MTYQSKKGRLLHIDFINSIIDSSFELTKDLSDTVTKPFKIMMLRDEENRLLQQRIKKLLMEKELGQEALIENKRLRELLKLRESKKNYVVSARVVARGVDHPKNILILDRGLEDGVKKDMAAMTPSGLAGKILDVSDSYSRLMLLTDISFSVAVRQQETRTEGIISGTGTGKCILKYIPYEEEIKTGDILITSGLDSLFPPGIPVGYVSKVHDKKDGGYFRQIEVVPFQDDTRIEEVLIVR